MSLVLVISSLLFNLADKLLDELIDLSTAMGLDQLGPPFSPQAHLVSMLKETIF